MRLRLIHAARPDWTKLFCDVRRDAVGGVIYWILDESRLLPTKYLKSEHVQRNSHHRS